MTQPTIITAQSQGYPPVSDANSDTRVYSDVVMPAAANTVIVFCVMDTTSGGTGRQFTDLTYGDAAAVRTFLIDVSSTRPRAVVGAIFDVSDAGALTADVTVTISSATTVTTRLGVVCSDGFVESFFTGSDGSAVQGQSVVYSNNYENNIFALLTGTDDIDGGFPYTNGTEIFTDSGGAGLVGVCAAYQTTNQADNTKKITYTASTEEAADLGVLLSSQRNPFQGGAGEQSIISHNIIKH